MSNTGTAAEVTKKKGSAGKTCLSILFFILILACAYILAKCMGAGAMNQIAAGKNILGEYSSILGSGIVNFIKESIGFWCAFSAVILWFGLWIVTTRRVASAIRGLGVACSIAALAHLIGELLNLLLTCVFSTDSIMTPYKDALPGLFADTCGDNVIFALSSMIIASFGIFICKIKKMPKRMAATQTVSTSASAEQTAPQPAPIAAAVHTSANDAPAAPIQEKTPAPAEAPSDESSRDVTTICHICGTQNDAHVKFCGTCGAKLS